MSRFFKNPGIQRLSRFTLFIIIIDVFILAIIEAGLRVLNIGMPIQSFIEEKQPDGTIWVTYKGNSIQQSFCKEKPADNFRIFCLGGSTMLGFPYHPRSSFAKILEWMMKAQGHPDLSVEMINIARTGADSHDVLRLMERSLEYDPDLILVYTGQNEFLRTSPVSELRHPHVARLRDFLATHCRIYQAISKAAYIAEVAAPAIIASDQEWLTPLARALPEQGDDELSLEWRAEKEQVFEKNIQNIFEKSQEKSLPMIAFRLAANLRDWPPPGKHFPPGMSLSQKEELKRSLKNAESLLNDDNPEAAEKVLKDIQDMAPDYAPVVFMLARALEDQGRQKEALEYFHKSHGLELEQHRAPPSFNRIISRLAKEKGIPLIETDYILMKKAGGAPGFELFEDHCHPNLQGQILIARALYNKLRQLDLMPSMPAISMTMEAMEHDIRSGLDLDQDFLREIKLRLAIFYSLNRSLPEENLKTIKVFEELVNYDPEDPFPRICLALIHLKEKHDQKAISLLSELMKQNQDVLRKNLKRYFSPGMSLRGDILMARIQEDFFQPPLAGMILVKTPPGDEPGDFPREPLCHFNRFWRWSGESWIDITGLMMKRLGERDEKLRQMRIKGTGFDSIKFSGRDIIRTHDLVEISSSEQEVCFNIHGNDPYLVFHPVQIDPLLISECEIRAMLRLPGPAGQKPLADLYWAQDGAPEFSEQTKLSFLMKPDAKYHIYHLALCEDPEWILGDMVTAIRLDPGNLPGELCLKHMAFRPYQVK